MISGAVFDSAHKKGNSAQKWQQKNGNKKNGNPKKWQPRQDSNLN